MEGFPGEKKRKYPKLSKIDIQKAQKGDNLPLLSLAGKKGAEKTNEIKRVKKAAEAEKKDYFETYDALKEAEAMEEIKTSTNERVVPFDPEEDAREAE